MKPLIKYSGGKSKELCELIPYIPKYSGKYIEPFFGGGAMYFHLEPQSAIINDINEPLMNFYRQVRDEFDTVKKELSDLQSKYEANRKAFDTLRSATPNLRVDDANEPLYYMMRDMFNGLIPKKYLDATIYYFINKTAYAGMIRYNSKGEYNVPYGRYKNFNTAILTEEHSALLQRTDIRSGNYKDVFNDATPEDFIFLDPPYDCIFSDYGNEEYKEGFGEKNHRQLAEDIKNLSTPTLLVIGKTPLIEELYGDMIVGEYSKSYSVNIRNRFKSEAVHCVITNY